MQVTKITVVAALGALAAFTSPSQAFTAPSCVGFGRSVAAQSAVGRIPKLGLSHATKAPIGAAPRAQKTGVTGCSMAGYNIDLTGKVAFVAGVADASGYGWAIAKQLANAGCTIIVGTWPPVMTLFERGLKKGFGEDGQLDNGEQMKIEKIYPLDAMFSTPDEVDEDTKANKRYAGLEGYDIMSCAAKVKADYGKVDFLIHSLANGPEVTKPLLETSRGGYLAASSASAYSMISMLQHFGPLMPEGGSAISLTYIASERVVPGYGGGMSSAKAQLESDTKVLAWEAGRMHGIRVNTISAGPLASRAAVAIKKGGAGERNYIDYCIDYNIANTPLPKPLFADDVGKTALALCSDLTAAVTGTCQYVDNGMHAMGLTVDSGSFKEYIDKQSGVPWDGWKPDVGAKKLAE